MKKDKLFSDNPFDASVCKIDPIMVAHSETELAIFGKTPMKLPLAKRSFDLDLDIWLGNRKEPNSQMHVQWFV